MSHIVRYVSVIMVNLLRKRVEKGLSTTYGVPCEKHTRFSSTVGFAWQIPPMATPANVWSESVKFDLRIRMHRGSS